MWEPTSEPTVKNLTPLLLDLKGLVYNSYHASMSREPITGSIKADINTAEHGFATFINKFFQPMLEIVDSPLHMIAVVDDGNVFRKSLLPTYKSARDTKKVEQDPLELAELDKCTALVKAFLASLGVTLVQLKGQEADDVIAYLVDKLHTKWPVIVATIDKDLLQLYPKAHIFRNGVIQETYKDNVPSHLIPLYISLIGDSTDGLTGIPGIGPKAWDSMVNDFGIDGMEELDALVRGRKNGEIRKAAELSHNAALKKAAGQWDTWYIQFQCGLLHPEICEGAKVKLNWYKRCPTQSRLHQALAKAGALDLLGDYVSFCYTQTLVDQLNYDQCMDEIKSLLQQTPCVPFDYETFERVPNVNHKLATNSRKGYVNVLNSEITGCSFAFGSNLQHVYYFSVEHKDTHNLPKQVIKEMFQLLESKGIDTVAQNISFERTVTKVQLGHELACLEDTRAYSHHLDENSENGLKYLSQHYLNYDQTNYQDTLDKYGAKHMADLTGYEVLDYACDDSLVTGQLYAHLSLRCQLEGTANFIYDYECPAVHLFSDAYIDGVKLDVEEMARQKAKDELECETQLALVHQLLSEHCTEPDLEAIERMYDDQKLYVEYKAKRALRNKGGASEEALQSAGKAALSKFKSELKQSSVYIIPYEEVQTREFIPTPARLTETTNFLGLPPIEKVTKAALSDYLSEVTPETQDQTVFMMCLAGAAHQLGKRSGGEYEILKAFCEQVYSNNTPKVMKGTVINLDSPKCISAILYLMLGLPFRIRTDVQPGSIRSETRLPGNPATDDSAVDFALANDCEGEFKWKAQVLKAFASYAKASTRLSNYWKPYPLWMDENHLLHPQYLSPGTVTRRPTGSNPNLLQVSKGDVRKCFIPRKPGNVIVSVDFASQELRVLASVTQDKNFLSAYIHGPDEKDKDLHTMTGCGVAPVLAKKYPGDLVSQLKLEQDGRVGYDWFLDQLALFDKPKDQVGHGELYLAKFLQKVRGISKTINFGAGYGATANTVSIQAMIPYDDAALAVDGMAATYPGIAKWKQVLYAFARKSGYVATTYGSRRHVGNALNEGKGYQIGRWERQLANFCIQGQCGDLLKVVLTNCHKTRLFKETDSYLIAAVYDELLSEVPMENVYEYLHRLADIMEIKMPGIEVPMVADCSLGLSWGEQVEIGIRPTKEKIEEVLNGFR
jgi:DNA polymerase I-like protein with 3'-5' exonuclease and polymerase domains/5'-3' exonuclease